MKWYVYMLRLTNGKIHVGSTNQLNRPSSDQGQLIYSESWPDQTSAVRRESQIKKLSRTKKLALVRDQLDRLVQWRDPRDEPALSVVIYRNPGPDESTIATEARKLLQKRSSSTTGGALGYITLFEPIFDRVWEGLNKGDLLGTAYAILMYFGPKGEQFIGRIDDFMFGWTDGVDEKYGNVLLLQIIPREHMLGIMN